VLAHTTSQHTGHVYVKTMHELCLYVCTVVQLSLYMSSSYMGAIATGQQPVSRPGPFYPPPPRQNVTPVPTEYEAAWVQETIWTLWRRNISLALSGNRPTTHRCPSRTLAARMTTSYRYRCVLLVKGTLYSVMEK